VELEFALEVELLPSVTLVDPKPLLLEVEVESGELPVKAELEVSVPLVVLLLAVESVELPVKVELEVSVPLVELPLLEVLPTSVEFPVPESVLVQLQLSPVKVVLFPLLLESQEQSPVVVVFPLVKQVSQEPAVAVEFVSEHVSQELIVAVEFVSVVPSVTFVVLLERLTPETPEVPEHEQVLISAVEPYGQVPFAPKGTTDAFKFE